jgi:hypothetical protein
MGVVAMTECFVGVVYFNLNGRPFDFEMSEELETYDEAVAFIEGCSTNEHFDYGIVEKRFKKGEAQQSSAQEGAE